MNKSNPSFDIPEDRISPIHSLAGRTLKTGWTVLQKVNSKPGATGGNFSVCYTVEKGGQTGFLKALNILSFLRGDRDMLQAMTEMLNAFNYEKGLLARCKNRNFDKVSKLLEADMENVQGFIIPNIYYMILERADDDVRNHLNFSGEVDVAWKLRSLHHICIGLQQLHSAGIQHQDVKPSNVFIFNNDRVSKIGDLGRSLCNDVASPYDGLEFTGDMRYAPPEYFHKFSLPETIQKLLAIDMFLLGSLATFYFTGQNMTSLLIQNLDNRINIYSINFDEAVAYWDNAFDASLEVVRSHLNGHNETSEIVSQISMLCKPDPRRRGHPTNINQRGSNFVLERFVSKFNQLAIKAEYHLTH